MRRRRASVLALVLLLGLIMGYGVASLTREVKVKYKVVSPDLGLEVNPNDLKEVWPGDKRELTAVVTNTGDAKLKVTLDAKYGEQIKEVVIGKNNFELNPKESVKVPITVVFDEKASPGDGELIIVVAGGKP